MSMFPKKPYIPPPFKGEQSTPEVVFHYAGDEAQTQPIQPAVYADIPVALPVARTAHTGVLSTEPFVYESPRNQYVRIAAQLQATADSSEALTGSCLVARIGDRDVLFTRELVRSNDGTSTSYDFDIEGCLYLREGDRLSLVFRSHNLASTAINCTITAAQFIAQNERSLLGKTL